ncbi:uncharacterized protein B0I36DRAFT_345935 [Microdochium trichocladiopsis]|uniref:Uncharacterized protein n=1 Tax=Microdochium trichocladiopsis TaxID=1682393 RepID=A0A9P8YFB9_9PEZI|nr:uncharacterized protein B0I36DRAFT_345935 [Microdochium trichocladiopsis]KAH7037882.1 hypothetical protein B0I36DRAFT_345935 [Microdochium trichocladiopsis]
MESLVMLNPEVLCPVRPAWSLAKACGLWLSSCSVTESLLLPSNTTIRHGMGCSKEQRASSCAPLQLGCRQHDSSLARLGQPPARPRSQSHPARQGLVPPASKNNDDILPSPLRPLGQLHGHGSSSLSREARHSFSSQPIFDNACRPLISPHQNARPRGWSFEDFQQPVIASSSAPQTHRTHPQTDPTRNRHQPSTVDAASANTGPKQI